jgi:tRNA(Leu) C34 or U34 (ribose-2'-O)-methylase TrmL
MGGTPLADFTHPDRAVYILGSEDNGLPSSVLRACAHHVSLPVASPDRTSSFNVAVTGALVLHDRLQKRRLGNEVAAVREGDALRGGRAGVDSAKPSQVIEANKNA